MERKEKIVKKHDAILKFIADWRVKKDITQWDMGEYLGLSESGYFKIEKGKTKLDLERLLLILDKLDISFVEFAKNIDF
jgi:transcriptional regulator with XRE-family HTH domain